MLWRVENRFLAIAALSLGPLFPKISKLNRSRQILLVLLPVQDGEMSIQNSEDIILYFNVLTCSTCQMQSMIERRSNPWLEKGFKEEIQKFYTNGREVYLESQLWNYTSLGETDPNADMCLWHLLVDAIVFIQIPSSSVLLERQSVVPALFCHTWLGFLWEK